MILVFSTFTSSYFLFKTSSILMSAISVLTLKYPKINNHFIIKHKKKKKTFFKNEISNWILIHSSVYYYHIFYKHVNYIRFVTRILNIINIIEYHCRSIMVTNSWNQNCYYFKSLCPMTVNEITSHYDIINNWYDYYYFF